MIYHDSTMIQQFNNETADFTFHHQWDFSVTHSNTRHVVLLCLFQLFFGHPTEIYSSQVSGKPQGLECFLSEDGWFAPWIPQNRQYSYIMENVWTCYVDCWPIKIEVFSTCSDTPLEKQKQHSNIQASGIASAKQSTELAPGCQHFSHVFHGWNR